MKVPSLAGGQAGVLAEMRGDLFVADHYYGEAETSLMASHAAAVEVGRRDYRVFEP